MSYRLTAERLGDTVLVQIDTPSERVTMTMDTSQAVELGWGLLVMGSTDTPTLTPEMVVTGRPVG